MERPDITNSKLYQLGQARGEFVAHERVLTEVRQIIEAEIAVQLRRADSLKGDNLGITAANSARHALARTLDRIKEIDHEA